MGGAPERKKRRRDLSSLAERDRWAAPANLRAVLHGADGK